MHTLLNLEKVRDKVPPEVFTTAYTNPVGGNSENVRANLRDRLNQVQAAAERAPQTAADTMTGLVLEGHQRNLSPAGKALAPRKDGSRYDPQAHVAGSYHAAVEGGAAMVQSNHRAAGWLRFGTKKMVARPILPGTVQNGRQDKQGRWRDERGKFVDVASLSLGWWLERISKAILGALRG